MNTRLAREVLGEEMLAGCMAAPKGWTRKLAVGTAVAGVAGAAVATRLGKRTDLPGGHKGLLYLAVSPTQVAFLEIKRGIFCNSLGQLLEKVSRNEIRACEFTPRLLRPGQLTVGFADGTSYQLEVPMFRKGAAKKVRALLTGASR